MANVKKSSHVNRFARRSDARLPYPTQTGRHRVCISRKDDPAPRLLTNCGRENHLFASSAFPMWRPRRHKLPHRHKDKQTSRFQPFSTHAADTETQKLQAWRTGTWRHCISSTSTAGTARQHDLTLWPMQLNYRCSNNKARQIFLWQQPEPLTRHARYHPFGEGHVQARSVLRLEQGTEQGQLPQHATEDL